MASPLQRFFLLFPPSSIERVKGAYASVLAAYYRLAISSLLNGLTSTPRNPPVIVSLTSTPSRLARSTDIAIATLLKQRFKPDHVVLWLSDEIKPEDLPSSFGNLKKAGL